jgi:hypothetical protein
MAVHQVNLVFGGELKLGYRDHFFEVKEHESQLDIR